MTFNSGQEMLDMLINSCDLYSEETSTYVFVYNDCGSIAYYGLDKDDMDRLKAEAKEVGECVSGLLGVGGHIIDDPSYDEYKEGDYSNLDWCNDNYKGEWEKITW